MWMLTWLVLSLVMPVPSLVSAVQFTLKPNEWVKVLNQNTFNREIEVNRTNMVAFYSSSLVDKTPLSRYIEAAKQLHPLVSAYVFNCDIDKSLCEERKIDAKESFRVSIMVFPRGTQLKTVVFPKETLQPNDIVSRVQEAVPIYVDVLRNIEHIKAWAGEICEPAIKKQHKQNSLILDKADEISNPKIKSCAESALVKDGEPKYRALLITREEIISFPWRVLANQYYGKIRFGVALNANGDVRKQLGLENDEKIVVFRAGSPQIPYRGSKKFVVVVNFLNTVLEGTSDLYEFSN